MNPPPPASVFPRITPDVVALATKIRRVHKTWDERYPNGSEDAADLSDYDEEQYDYYEDVERVAIQLVTAILGPPNG